MTLLACFDFSSLSSRGHAELKVLGTLLGLCPVSQQIERLARYIAEFDTEVVRSVSFRITLISISLGSLLIIRRFVT
jgi:hypothetical protein